MWFAHGDFLSKIVVSKGGKECLYSEETWQTLSMSGDQGYHQQ